MGLPKIAIAWGILASACSSSSNAEEYFGKFIDLPVALSTNPNALPKPFKVTKTLHFEDPNGLKWVVPVGSHTDGATIPWLFELIVGDNYGGPYFPAAVVHDYFCCIQTRMAHDTHRNFYYAMRANGTPEWQAWLMYIAVSIGGPDWTLTQSGTTADGSLCFDEVAALAMPPSTTTAVDSDVELGMTRMSQSPNFDAFLRAATTAQNQRDTFLVSKLTAVSKTLRDSGGKVIDVTAFGEIPATFDGVEQLKAIVDGATSFAGFSGGPMRSNFGDFGLLVPIDGDLQVAKTEIRGKGGLVATAIGWSSAELGEIGINAASLPTSLPASYLVDAAKTNKLDGTGVEWATANSAAERSKWNQVIDADRSYRTWLNARDVFTRQ